MIFVFDTSAFIVTGHYFPSRFPSFWQKLDDLVASGLLVSVKEVRRELDKEATRDHLKAWITRNSRIFVAPDEDQASFVAEIFRVPHFRQLVGDRAILNGTPAADPFVIASAHAHEACVVTEEKLRPNAAKIPNVCEHFHVACTDTEGFMAQLGWSF